MTRRCSRILALVTFLVIVVLLALAEPSRASTFTVSGPDAPEATALYTQWLSESRMPLPEPFVVEHRDCPEYRAQMCVRSQRRIMQIPDWSHIFRQASSARDRMMYRHAFYHETGHLWDHDHAERTRWRHRFSRIMGQRGRWATRSGVWRISGRAPGWEYFADAYALCSLDPVNLPPYDEAWPESYGFRPNAWQHQRVCALIVRVSQSS